MRRLSDLLIATRREAPADASTASHALLVRAGMVQPIAPGLVALGPLLARVATRITAIAREELAAVGGQEIRLPCADPAQPLHQASDHEAQAATYAAGVLSSHRQLPQVLHEVATVRSDDPRPRSGLLGAAERSLCAAYAFDADEAAAEAGFARAAGALARVLARCDLEALRAEAGGTLRAETFVAPGPAGETLVAVSDAGRYRAVLDVARAALTAPERPEPEAMTRVDTPGATTMEALAPHVGDVPAARTVKTLLYRILTDDGSHVVAALCRGDRSVHEGKLAGALGATEVAMADAATIRELTGAEPGFTGPVGLPEMRVLGDLALADVQGFVCGANETDAHLRDAWWGRDVALPDLFDLDLVTEGDPAPDGGRLAVTRGIAVGWARLLGTGDAESAGLTVAGPDGAERPVWLGSYGLALEALVAALVEQHHDAEGIVWPAAIAPHTAVVVTVRAGDEAQDGLAERVMADLATAGVDALWDDRDVRAGVKFTDAELIGFPWRITAGREAAEGRVELTGRAGGRTEVVDAADAVARIADAAGAAGVPALP